MLKGKTDTGFRFSIDEEARDDMELLENLALMAGGDLSVMPNTLVMLLGEEQKKKLYDHCRGESGRVSSKKVMAELEDIFNKAGEADTDLKN